jgi:hypothetical protein
VTITIPIGYRRATAPGTWLARRDHADHVLAFVTIAPAEEPFGVAQQTLFGNFIG